MYLSIFMYTYDRDVVPRRSARFGDRSRRFLGKLKSDEPTSPI